MSIQHTQKKLNQRTGIGFLIASLCQLIVASLLVFQGTGSNVNMFIATAFFIGFAVAGIAFLQEYSSIEQIPVSSRTIAIGIGVLLLLNVIYLILVIFRYSLL